MKKLPLIEVEWEDIAGQAGWQNEEQVKATEPIHCVNVGWQIKSTAKKLIICAGRNDQGDYSDRSTIPKGCIKSIRRIE